MGQEQTGGPSQASKVTAVRSLHERYQGAAMRGRDRSIAIGYRKTFSAGAHHL